MLIRRKEIPVITSEVRDHLANERTFLSALKLGLSLSLVALVCFLDVRLNKTFANLHPKRLHPVWKTLQRHRPVVHDRSALTAALAYAFLAMALLAIVAATHHYLRTQQRYLRRIAVVRDHPFVNGAIGLVGMGILVANLLLLYAERRET